MASSASTRAGVAEPARPGVEWATALYDYAEDSDGDLSFKQGDRILISRHVDAEWSFGRVGGREGVFPRAFVESDAGTERRSHASLFLGTGRASSEEFSSEAIKRR